MTNLCEGCKHKATVYGDPYCLKNQRGVTYPVRHCVDRESEILPWVNIPDMKPNGMKRPVFFGIAFRIIGLCFIAMLVTFIPEQAAVLEFFGDQYQCRGANGTKCEALTYAPRHFWYNVATGFLFVLSLIDVIVGIVLTVRSHYDTKTWP